MQEQNQQGQIPSAPESPSRFLDNKTHEQAQELQEQQLLSGIPSEPCNPENGSNILEDNTLEEMNYGGSKELLLHYYSNQDQESMMNRILQTIPNDGENAIEPIIQECHQTQHYTQKLKQQTQGGQQREENMNEQAQKNQQNVQANFSQLQTIFQSDNINTYKDITQLQKPNENVQIAGLQQEPCAMKVDVQELQEQSNYSIVVNMILRDCEIQQPLEKLQARILQLSLGKKQMLKSEVKEKISIDSLENDSIPNHPQSLPNNIETSILDINQKIQNENLQVIPFEHPIRNQQIEIGKIQIQNNFIEINSHYNEPMEIQYSNQVNKSPNQRQNTNAMPLQLIQTINTGQNYHQMNQTTEKEIINIDNQNQQNNISLQVNYNSDSKHYVHQQNVNCQIGYQSQIENSVVENINAKLELIQQASSQCKGQHMNNQNHQILEVNNMIQNTMQPRSSQKKNYNEVKYSIDLDSVNDQYYSSKTKHDKNIAQLINQVIEDEIVEKNMPINHQQNQNQQFQQYYQGNKEQRTTTQDNLRGTQIPSSSQKKSINYEILSSARSHSNKVKVLSQKKLIHTQGNIKQQNQTQYVEIMSNQYTNLHQSNQKVNQQYQIQEPIQQSKIIIDLQNSTKQKAFTSKSTISVVQNTNKFCPIDITAVDIEEVILNPNIYTQPLNKKDMGTDYSVKGSKTQYLHKQNQQFSQPNVVIYNDYNKGTVQQNQKWFHRPLVQETVAQTKIPQMPPCITININRHNEISLNIFNNNFFLKEKLDVKEMIEQKLQKEIVQNEVETSLQDQRAASPFKNTAIECKKQKKNSTNNFVQHTNPPLKDLNARPNEINVNLSSSTQNQKTTAPQEKIGDVSHSMEENQQIQLRGQSLEQQYSKICVMADTFLIKEQLQENDHLQLERLLMPHVKIRMTPEPISAVGEQLFKNGLILTAMVKMISRSSKTPFLPNYIFQYLDSSFNIEHNYYIFKQELGRAKSNYQNFLENQYADKYNQCRLLREETKNEGPVKRSIIQEPALIENTDGKQAALIKNRIPKLTLRSGQFNVNQQVRDLSKTITRILHHQATQMIPHLDSSPKTQTKQNVIINKQQRISPNIQQSDQNAKNDSLRRQDIRKSVSSIPKTETISQNVSVSASQINSNKFKQNVEKQKQLTKKQNTQNVSNSRAKLGQLLRQPPKQTRQKQEVSSSKYMEDSNKSNKFNDLYQRYKMIRETKISETITPTKAESAVTVNFPLTDQVEQAEKKKKHVQFVEQPIQINRANPALAEEQAGGDKLRRKKRSKRLDSSMEDSEEVVRVRRTTRR